MNLMPVIISAPFGNWLEFPWATPTLGTFTLRPRGGVLKRIWRCALTLRPLWRAQGWINKLGLPNPGIDSIRFTPVIDKIVSIHGFAAYEWDALAERMNAPVMNRCPVELNLSCPNVGHKPNVYDVFRAVKVIGPDRVIVKVPPVRWMDVVSPLAHWGVKYFHCCNTIPTPGGGISGKPLKQYSLAAVEDVKRVHREVIVIGGGGVTCMQDYLDYTNAGADHVAVGSALLNPFRWRSIRQMLGTIAADPRS